MNSPAHHPAASRIPVWLDPRVQSDSRDSIACSTSKRPVYLMPEMACMSWRVMKTREPWVQDHETFLQQFELIGSKFDGKHVRNYNINARRKAGLASTPDA